MRRSFNSKMSLSGSQPSRPCSSLRRPASADVVKIVVDDAIHPIVTERIERAIQEADRTTLTRS